MNLTTKEPEQIKNDLKAKLFKSVNYDFDTCRLSSLSKLEDSFTGLAGKSRILARLNYTYVWNQAKRPMTSVRSVVLKAIKENEKTFEIINVEGPMDEAVFVKCLTLYDRRTLKLLEDEVACKSATPCYINPCTKHDNNTLNNVIYTAVGIKLDVVTCVCFFESSYKFFGSSEKQVQIGALQKLLDSLKFCEKGKSLFLCRFPLLSQILVGTLMYLKDSFSQVCVLSDECMRITGVAAINRFGSNEPALSYLWSRIKLLKGNDTAISGLALSSIVDSIDHSSIVSYNENMIKEDLCRHIASLIYRTGSDSKKIVSQHVVY